MLGRTHKAFAATSAATMTLLPYYDIAHHGDSIGYYVTPFLYRTLIADSSTYLTTSLIVIGAAWFSGRLPDIDVLVKQHISKKIHLKHRSNMTHSIYPILLLMIITALMPNTTWHAVALGVTIGYASHVFGDAFSVRGVDWFGNRGVKQYYNPNGTVRAEVIRGKRRFFKSLYKTGNLAFGILPAHLFWYGVAAALIGLNVLYSHTLLPLP